MRILIRASRALPFYLYLLPGCGTGQSPVKDTMLNANGSPFVLEINTIPGMTSSSLLPKAARAVGIEFDELVWRVLETSFTRTRIG